MLAVVLRLASLANLLIRRDVCAYTAYDHQKMNTTPPQAEQQLDGHKLVLHPSGRYIQVPVDHRVDAAGNPNLADLPAAELTCKYKSTHCSEPRSLKANGELHNLCEFHRERANANQARFDAKQRQRRQEESGVDLPEPIQSIDKSQEPAPLEEWEADLLLEQIQDNK